MSKREAIVVAGRALSVLLTVWALAEVSYLPGTVHSFLRYVNQEPGSSTAIQYWRHYYLISLSFLVTRIVGLSLMARWLYKGGQEVEELLLPPAHQENTIQTD